MQLPDRPNLAHLHDQAQDLVRSGAVPTLADAQVQFARQYGFSSWPELTQHVESLEKVGQLKQVSDPYGNGYDAETCRRLAVNVVSYALQN